MKKRILVTIVGQGSIIHLIRTGIIDELKLFCEPVIALLWQQNDLMEELRKKNFEVYIIPAYKTTAEYSDLRNKINRWYQKNILKSPSTEIQEKFLDQYKNFNQKFLRDIRKIVLNVKSLFIPGYIKKIISKEDAILRDEKVWQTYSKWIDEIKVDGLYTVTPFLKEIELIARIMKRHNKPLLAAIHSFDNVTKRGWPAIFFDHYLVWNKHNKQEMQRINSQLKDDDITIMGAPQFDFHFSEIKNINKAEWFAAKGLPNDKKIILYSGGSVHLFPNEPQYLQHLNNAIKNNELQNCVILFRSHPLDKMQRWKDAIGESEFIIYDEAPSGKENMDHTNVTMENIYNLIATLAFTDVHINLCSTMTVDGSVFNKPQIGPAYDDFSSRKNEKLLKQMYYQEHFLPVLKTNVLQLAQSKTQLIALVKNALSQKLFSKEISKACVEEIITFTDGKSAKRAVLAVKTFFSSNTN